MTLDQRIRDQYPLCNHVFYCFKNIIKFFMKLLNFDKTEEGELQWIAWFYEICKKCTKEPY